jgi:hypothetical protein
MAIFVVPHLVLAAVLVAQGSLGAFFEQAFSFNRAFYARYELAADPISIVFRSLVDRVQTLPAYVHPTALRDITGFLFLSNIVAVVLVWKQRGALIGLAYCGVFLLSQLRGDTGYHGAPYFAVAMVSLAVVITFCVETGQRLLRNRRQGSSVRLVLGAACAAYVVLAVLFYRDSAGFFRRLDRGLRPDSLYVRAVHTATLPTDRIWAAPFEPDVYLGADRAPASRYAYFFPWLSDSEAITEQLLQDLATEQPLVVIFRADKEIPWYFPLPTPRQYATRIHSYLSEHYVAVREGDAVLRDMLIRRDQADLLRARLRDANIGPGG